MKTIAVLSQPLAREERADGQARFDMGIWVPPSEPRKTTVERLIDLHRPSKLLLDEKLGDHWASVRSLVPTQVVRTAVQSNLSGKVFVFASSDTLVRSLLPIAENLPGTFPVDYFIPYRSLERAGPTFRAKGISPRQNILSALVRERPRLLLLANDWNYDSRIITRFASRIGIRTVCVQESVINLADSDSARMLQADHSIVQGVATTTMLRRRHHWLAGNPRYEDLCATPIPTDGQVLINCNFTYGIQSEFREKWLESCTRSLKKLGIRHFIAQHPRDFADVSAFGEVVPSHAGKVHDLVRKSSAVISRFSSVLHEAVALGRPAMYYNPHRELGGYDFRPYGRGLGYAENEDDLERWLVGSVVQREADLDQSISKNLAEYGTEHFRPLAARPSLVSSQFATLIASGVAPVDGRANSMKWTLKGIKEILKGLVLRVDK